MLPAFMHLPLSTGYVLASLLSCAPQPAPAVTLERQNNPPTISHARSSAYLMKLKKYSSSPNYGGEFPIIDGLTNGVFQLKYDIEFAEETQGRKACVAASAVHITITYKPTIYVSSNVPKGSCRYGVTLKHEMRHVNADLDTIDEFTPDIKAAAADALRHAQTAEPINSNQVAEMRDALSDKLSKEVDEQTAALQKERTSRQRKIDSRAEYERLSRACPGEPVR